MMNYYNLYITIQNSIQKIISKTNLVSNGKKSQPLKLGFSNQYLGVSNIQKIFHFTCKTFKQSQLIMFAQFFNDFHLYDLPKSTQKFDMVATKYQDANFYGQNIFTWCFKVLSSAEIQKSKNSITDFLRCRRKYSRTSPFYAPNDFLSKVF